MDPSEDPEDPLRAHRSRERTFIFDTVFDQQASQVPPTFPPPVHIGLQCLWEGLGARPSHLSSPQVSLKNKVGVGKIPTQGSRVGAPSVDMGATRCWHC